MGNTAPRRVRSRLALRIYLAGLAQFGAVILGFILLVRQLAPQPRPPERRREAHFAAESLAARASDEATLESEVARIRDTLHADIALYDETGTPLTRLIPGRSAVSPGPLLDLTETPAPPFDAPPAGATSALPHSGPHRALPPGTLPPGALPPGAPLHDALPPGGPPPGAPPHGVGFPPPPLGGRAWPLGPRPPGASPDVPRGPEFRFLVRLPDGRRGQVVYTPLFPGAPPPPAHHIALIIALVLVVVGVASLLTARSLARPLARLSQAVRALGAGQLEARVGLARTDEIGEVAAAFDEMADRLTALLRAERELLANVSHELRTPLARIRVALDLASEGDAKVARQSLGEITEDLAELERLISDVLTAARLDLAHDSGASGIPPLRHERLEVGDLLERAATRFRSAHRDRPLLVELAPELGFVDGDPVLLRRVIDNLLENAHKYTTRPDAPITLRATRAAAEILIEVCDQGIGIAAEDMPKIFRPFFRTDRSRTRATGGLGLGLALARRIVEAHHGTIALDSELGKGTRASVRLPAPPPSSRKTPQESNASPAAS
ncbi:HAMP domain-containing sensor histidine kinase [Chondromyces crocatus]|uniref:histidine kinase n=1 Tax=Chondromyces crocatus TaxID=52 RepID=A0A0K1ETC8_CHOCO|nr:HAMP domain-containing sensor histidine kinase [Chondromyces crocatus]AKT44101.1 uncharacterized protein CMC5_083410 [Chondromyces crocatus]